MHILSVGGKSCAICACRSFAPLLSGTGERASCGRRVRAAACARRTGPYYFDDDAATDYPTPVEHGAYAAAGHDYAPEKHPTTPGA